MSMKTNVFTFGAIVAAILAPAHSAIAQTGGINSAPQNKSQGQVIATFYYSNSDKGWDRNGRSIDIADYQKVELYLLAEYRATDELTLIATPSFRNVSVEDGDDTRGLGYTELGARYDLAAGEGWTVAAQGTVRIPGSTRQDNLAQVGNTNVEYDARLRGTYGFAVGLDSAFIDVQTSYRFRAGDPPNEFHGDVTVGYRPVSDLLLMAQSFNTISDGRGAGIFDRYRYHNVQLSAVKDVGNGVSIQAGWLGTVAGENALRERGFFGGLWVRF